eukprot:546194-Pelagomonas_calceolata.AAC.2
MLPTWHAHLSWRPASLATASMPTAWRAHLRWGPASCRLLIACKPSSLYAYRLVCASEMRACLIWVHGVIGLK